MLQLMASFILKFFPIIGVKFKKIPSNALNFFSVLLHQHVNISVSFKLWSLGLLNFCDSSEGGDLAHFRKPWYSLSFDLVATFFFVN